MLINEKYRRPVGSNDFYTRLGIDHNFGTFLEPKTTPDDFRAFELLLANKFHAQRSDCSLGNVAAVQQKVFLKLSHCFRVSFD